MGYKVTLDEKSIDKTLKPTLSYQTTTDQDSDLVKRSGNYALMKKMIMLLQLKNYQIQMISIKVRLKQ